MITEKSKLLSDMLQELKESALVEAKKRKHPRFRASREYWRGFSQAYANAACLAYGFEVMEGKRKPGERKSSDPQRSAQK